MTRSDSMLRRHGPLALTIMLCAVLGALLVERLTRPVDLPEPIAPSGQQGPGQPGTSLDEPGPDTPPPATTEDLIAQVKRMADRLLVAFPDDPRASTLAGEIYYGFGEVAKAIACWEQCAKRHPEFSDAWAALGAAAWEQGDFEKGAAHLQRAYALNPKLPGERLYLLADCLMNTARPEQTAALIEHLGATQKVSVGGLLLLGQAYLELQQDAKAKRQFEAVLAADPDSPSAHFALARALTRLGEHQKAQAHREQYARLKGRELARTERGRLDRLKTDLLRVHPAAAAAAVSVGKLYALHGQGRQAERLWRWAAAVDPQNAEARKLLEILLQPTGGAPRQPKE